MDLFFQINNNGPFIVTQVLSLSLLNDLCQNLSFDTPVPSVVPSVPQGKNKIFFLTDIPSTDEEGSKSTSR